MGIRRVYDGVTTGIKGFSPTASLARSSWQRKTLRFRVIPQSARTVRYTCRLAGNTNSTGARCTRDAADPVEAHSPAANSVTDLRKTALDSINSRASLAPGWLAPINFRANQVRSTLNLIKPVRNTVNPTVALTLPCMLLSRVAAALSAKRTLLGPASEGLPQ